MLSPMTGLFAETGNGNTAVHGLEQGFRCRSLGAVKQRVATAHPQVRKQDTAVVEVDEKVFCTTTNVDDRGTC